MTGHPASRDTPRQRVTSACARWGTGRVVLDCRRLLRGEGVDGRMLVVLGGEHARAFLDGAPRTDDYWLRVWGARGLLWAWDDSAVAELRAATGDPAWRVREMALKVVARHRVDPLLEEVVERRADPVERVRSAAERALRSLAG